MSKRIEIRVPDIGDFTDIPVIEVLIAAGDHVDAEQSLVTLESDKATMEVPSPAAGVIISLGVALDDLVSEGSLIATLEVDESPRPFRKSANRPGQRPHLRSRYKATRLKILTRPLITTSILLCWVPGRVAIPQLSGQQTWG